MDVTTAEIYAIYSDVNRAEYASTHEEMWTELGSVKVRVQEMERRVELSTKVDTPNISFSDAANAVKQVNIDK